MNNISWMKRWWNQLTCLWWSNVLGIYLYLVAILDSRCGWGIQRGTFPNIKNSYPPPHTISVHGLRHLAFEHLALYDPEPFCPLGTLVTWTISFFSSKCNLIWPWSPQESPSCSSTSTTPWSPMKVTRGPFRPRDARTWRRSWKVAVSYYNAAATQPI